MDFLDTLYGRENTIKTQTCLFNKWIRPLLPLDLSSDVNIISVIKIWESKDLAPRTIKSLISLLGRYGKWQGTPFETRKYVNLTMRRQQEDPIKAFTRAEARAILNHTHGNFKTACMLAYHAGLRKGEIFGLEWRDVDFLSNRLFIQRSYNGPTKNGKSRYVPMSKELGQHLLDKTAPKSDNYSETKKVVKQFDPGPRLRSVCKKVGARPLTIHAFRHSFATLALEAGKGENIKQVSMTLGHSSVKITIDQYWSNLKGDLNLEFL